jgi:hypothetical protein
VPPVGRSVRPVEDGERLVQDEDHAERRRGRAPGYKGDLPRLFRVRVVTNVGTVGVVQASP